ncbi:hypothetical protein ACR3QJ_005348 [Citrobacter freundii]|uniref:hypothetical protein n=1 Tax=Citrobacter freundii complex TaxID=1344959 RepID=UPI000F4D6411|nr:MULTISPECIES: hypothetical protein [Citrobacter]AYY46527.1 hypothetical protein EGY10_22420 [Citrobacter freundii]MBJ8405414.1 hypothetical protein [Citrobacter cronae]HCT6408993.1 hypothetical protein [Citrobacter freundii]
MDWLTFFSKLIESCAWPGVLLFIAIQYRLTLIALFESLTSIKVGDLVDASFSRKTAEVATKSEAELPNVAVDAEQHNLEQKLLELPPRLAILDSWKILEAAITNYLQHHNLQTATLSRGYARRLGPGQMVHELQNASIITHTQIELIKKLLMLRNEVVHGPYGLEPSQDDAMNYVKSALTFANLFKIEMTENE